MTRSCAGSKSTPRGSTPPISPGNTSWRWRRRTRPGGDAPGRRTGTRSGSPRGARARDPVDVQNRARPPCSRPSPDRLSSGGPLNEHRSLSIVAVAPSRGGDGAAPREKERGGEAVARMQKKSINTPDETRSFDSFKMDLARVDGVTFGRSILQPGWKWSTRMKPVVKTESCQVPHTFYQVSGITHVVTDDGTMMDFAPGDLGIVPHGHDEWVVSAEPACTFREPAGREGPRVPRPTGGESPALRGTLLYGFPTPGGV